MGFSSTPNRARLPGEDVSGAGGAPLVATEAQPLVETADAPPEPEEKPQEKPVEVAEAPPEKLEVEAPPLAVPPVKPAPPPEDKLGDVLDAVTPPPTDAPIY